MIPCGIHKYSMLKLLSMSKEPMNLINKNIAVVDERNIVLENYKP